MKNLIIFMKKEIMELWRTYKMVILCIVFIILGMMSPLFAKLTPEILKMSGLEMAYPDPTVYDSYAQLFNNVEQLGLLMVLIMFGGSLIKEKKQGTAGLLTARGMPRWVIVSGKLLSGIVMWSVAYGLACGVCYGYTVYLFPDHAVEQLPLALASTWLFGVMLLCIASCLSTMFKSSGVPIGISIVFVYGLNLWKQMASLSPKWLFLNNLNLLKGEVPAQDLLIPFLCAGAVCLMLIVGAVLIFNKNEL